VDPRWDDEGFNAWADEVQLQFILIGYLRELLQAGEVLPAAQWLPRRACHIGAPPSGAEIYNVLHLWITTEHPDPWGDHLADLVELLHDSDDSDLVLIDFCSAPQKHYTAGGTSRRYQYQDQHTAEGQCEDPLLRLSTKLDGTPDWTDLTVEQERRLRAWQRGVSHKAWHVTYSGLRTVVLHKMPERTPAERRRKVHESVWLTAELILSAYCQRIVNSGDPEVQMYFAPAMLMDPVNRIREGCHSGQLRITNISDLEGIILPALTRSIASMVPVGGDSPGFAAFCVNSRVAWIKVGFVRRFTKMLRADVPERVIIFPRRQELPRGEFYEGVPPRGSRRFVVSHPWACEYHPTPSAERIRRLVRVLDTVGAQDTDGVFF